MSTQIVPIPRCDVNVRPATLADVPFIDALQKRHDKQLGFLRESWIEEKIKKGEVLVAENPHPNPPPEYREREKRVGYVIAQDKYNKREELGLVVQLCVAPDAQRGYVGMALIKAAFDRAAYGCRLFCCWCAQDIEANRFWESMGFVPLAYRAGSEKKGRVHIFWQKRIREGDVSTPWWYPTETTGGAIGEGRIVLPIPPGKHWSDELPVLLPREEGTKLLENEGRKVKKPKAPVLPVSRKLWFAPPVPVSSKAEKKPKEKKPRATCPERSRRKNDPKLVSAARELRDRWLEHVNAGEMLLESVGKYDVSRALPDARPVTPLLPAA